MIVEQLSGLGPLLREPQAHGVRKMYTDFGQNLPSVIAEVFQ
jgi:hypothetical protein